jgi:hypothetical protein
VYALPLVYKRERALVRTQVPDTDRFSWTDKFFGTHRVHKLSQAIQHISRCMVLRSGDPNHSKSLCLFRVQPPFDQAFLGLPQTHPKLGLGGCIPSPDWRFPPTFGVPGRGLRFGLGLVKAQDHDGAGGRASRPPDWRGSGIIYATCLAPSPIKGCGTCCTTTCCGASLRGPIAAHTKRAASGGQGAAPQPTRCGGLARRTEAMA